MAAASKGQRAAARPPSGKLDDQAATAAAFVTKGKGRNSHPLLDKDGRLSSAGAALSLKYAKPQELPSFPSPGLQIASAGAAASLADTNKKSVELWKPGSIPAAERAAHLAKDYEPDPLWQPELSTAGSKAALLASDKGATVEIWKAQESDGGYLAAEQAVRKKPLASTDQSGMPANASRKALMAAAGAMASSRRRADSAPTALLQSPPGTPTSAEWALKAAAQSQRGQRSTLSTESSNITQDAARIQNIAQSNVSRQMYTSHPPVALEVEEKNRQDTIRASAVAMAQKMYAIQQRAIEEAKSDINRADSRYAARNVHNRRTSEASAIAVTPEPLTSPFYGNNLQEAAQRLAQERLAKLRNEHDEYKKYYGQKSPPARSRLSIHNKLRRRASSDGAADELDEEQSRKIRSQMSIFQNNLAAIDEKKRKKDRDALLAAAQKNVRASMQSMDEEVFQETGKSSPAQREAWAAKAKEKAQAGSDSRMENYGKVHIGGGKYLDQSDVDAVARSRVQPTLDGINEKAELQHAREAEARLEEEEQKRRADLEKQRAVELKAEEKKARGEEKRDEKSKRAEEKRAHKEEMALLKEKEKVEKEEIKIKAKIEKEQLKEKSQMEEEQRKPKEEGKGFLPPLAINTQRPAGAEVGDTDHPGSPDGQTTAESAVQKVRRSVEAPEDSSEERERSTIGQPGLERTTAPLASPSKDQSKVKSWFAEKFRRSSKAAKDDNAQSRKPGFIGGLTLTGSGSAAGAGEDKIKEGSMHEVAMAGRPTIHQLVTKPQVDEPVSPIHGNEERTAGDRSSISSPSDSGEEDREKRKPRRGRLGLKERLTGKRNTRTLTSSDSEEFDEAHDTLEEGKLAPPPKLVAINIGTKARGSPVRDSRFSENL